MTEITELLERLNSATGPDREIDAALEVSLVKHGWVTSAKDPGAVAATADHFAVDGKLRYITSQSCRAQQYTASIDAALALVERCLPMAFVTIEKFSVSDENAGEWRVWVKVLNESDLAGDGPTVRQSKGFGKSQAPALAILTALLVALLAQAAK